MECARTKMKIFSRFQLIGDSNHPFLLVNTFFRNFTGWFPPTFTFSQIVNSTKFSSTKYLQSHQFIGTKKEAKEKKICTKPWKEERMFWQYRTPTLIIIRLIKTMCTKKLLMRFVSLFFLEEDRYIENFVWIPS